LANPKPLRLNRERRRRSKRPPVTLSGAVRGHPPVMKTHSNRRASLARWELAGAALLAVLCLAACGPETRVPPEPLEQIVLDAEAKTASEQVPAHFVCPMHPQIVRDGTGSCPICGMDLVEKQIEPAMDERPRVTLDASVVQNMGVRTAKVRRGILQRHIHTQGNVTYDEDRVIHVHSRAPGWVETLNMRTDGETVKRKDELAQFFSPLIVQIQLEYIAALEELDLAALKSADHNEANASVQSLRNTLKLLRVMDMDIMHLEKYRSIKNTVPIMAPQGGVVTKLGVREGMYVEPEDTMFTIVDLSRLWVMVDIYEHQMSWIKPGLRATIKAPATFNPPKSPAVCGWGPTWKSSPACRRTMRWWCQVSSSSIRNPVCGRTFRVWQSNQRAGPSDPLVN